MNIELWKGGEGVAIISGGGERVTSAQSALEMAMAAKYETGASRLVMPKELFCEDFFILSTGLAGEILQKFVNYQIKAAIYGDYSRYTSKPLRDFIYESNQGKNFFFVATKEEALQRLAGESL